MVSDGTRLFTWTQAGYLSSATVGAYQTLYAYNGLGQRVKKVTGAGSAAAARHYVYAEDGVSLLGEYSQPSAAAPVSALYEVVYLEGIPVLALAGGQVYFIQADHLNAPRTIKNSAGAVVWKWESDAFGNGAANQNPGGVALFEFNLRFPGQQYDAETGLYYNNARYYDPTTGRYISSDPIGLAGGINTYGYVGQAPTGAVDPTGLIFPLAFPVAYVSAMFLANAYRLTVVSVAVAELAAGTSMLSHVPVPAAAVPAAKLAGFVDEVGGFCAGAARNLSGFHANGRQLINSRYAGEFFPLPPALASKYPEGVRFSTEGFPDFSPYAISRVTSSELKGTKADFMLANKLAGRTATPAGYTWHHVEDGSTLYVPSI